MTSITVSGAALSTPLQDLLQNNDAIQPGYAPSYQICKELYEYHPLGAKIAEAPIIVAQSQRRDIAIPDSPEEMVRDRFNEKWEDGRTDEVVLNVAASARVYGVSTLALVTDDRTDPEKPLDFKKLASQDIAFSMFDPLNTAGSLVLNQNPLSFDFQKVQGIAVQGQRFHPSRTCVLMNERPIFIGYTSSAFGYVGRSVYQRALFPMKSFLNTMVTDDMVAIKAGLLIAALKQPGSIVDAIMTKMSGFKLNLLKTAVVGNVLQVGIDDKITSIDFTNLEPPMSMAHSNILTNIATAVPMPARWLKQDTLTVGFGEGSEDAKSEAKFVDNFREWMNPVYGFLDRIVQRRAWTPEWYAHVQEKFPAEYGSMSFDRAFYKWQNSFVARWPSLLEEPDSEKIKVDDVKLKAAIALLEVLLPMMDPVNKVLLIQFACDTFNELKLLFPNPIQIDWDALEKHAEEQAEMAEDAQAQLAEGGDQQGQEPKAPKPFRSDSISRWEQLDKAIAALSEIRANPNLARERRAA